MLDKLRALEIRYESLEARLSDPAVYASPEKTRQLNGEMRELADVVETFRTYRRAVEDCADAEALLSDPELCELARDEYEQARTRRDELEQRLRILLLPRDPDDNRSVIMEIRSGTGGEEAALFAHSLLRMYTMYALKRGWKFEIFHMNPTELGGVKECGVLIDGDGAFARLKFESGVHRVQRIPETESAGRIHTSAATVAVLPEADDVEIQLDPKDIKVDTYRSSGAGGQHVNKTESAIRLTHIPTGLVVECQDERSQYKNRDRAMKVLKSRLLDMERSRQTAQTAAERRHQIGSGDRSERVRTYNFPQGRVTDHRIGLTLYRLDAVMDGALDELIDALITADRTRQLLDT